MGKRVREAAREGIWVRGRGFPWMPWEPCCHYSHPPIHPSRSASGLLWGWTAEPRLPDLCMR